MASIQTGSAQGGRKVLDSELPLVPFIDLLLCCVMFLLVAAVWNRLAAVEVTSPSASPIADAVPPPSLTLSMTEESWTLITAERARFEMLAGDEDALREALQARQANETDLSIAPDDGVTYDVVIAAIDVALGTGIRDVSMVGDGTP